MTFAHYRICVDLSIDSSSNLDVEFFATMNAAAGNMVTLTDEGASWTTFRGGSRPDQATNCNFDIQHKCKELDREFFPYRYDILHLQMRSSKELTAFQVASKRKCKEKLSRTPFLVSDGCCRVKKMCEHRSEIIHHNRDDG